MRHYNVSMARTFLGMMAAISLMLSLSHLKKANISLYFFSIEPCLIVLIICFLY